MYLAHQNSDNLIFIRMIFKGLCSNLIKIKTTETQKNILYVYLSLFLPLLSERENYKRFTASLLRRVGKAYTQSFNLDLGSFHTIASEALKWRESEGRLSFNQERSKKYSTFQIFLRQYYMTEPFPLIRAILQWISEETYFERNIARALHCL